MNISVITVCFNAVDTIEETILSVVNQTYPDIEYIIIDGGSTDGTVEIIKKYADRLDYWISEPDKGIYDAMNKGIAVATGDYINFMNAGDSFFDAKVIENVFAGINDQYDVIYGKTNRITLKSSYIQDCAPLECLSEFLPFSHQASFAKLSRMREMGFDTEYRCAADYNFFYSIWEMHGNFHEVSQVIANYDEREGFSIINKKLCIKEYAKINGSDKSFLWPLKYFLICTKLDLFRKK